MDSSRCFLSGLSLKSIPPARKLTEHTSMCLAATWMHVFNIEVTRPLGSGLASSMRETSSKCKPSSQLNEISTEHDMKYMDLYLFPFSSTMSSSDRASAHSTISLSTINGSLTRVMTLSPYETKADKLLKSPSILIFDYLTNRLGMATVYEICMYAFHFWTFGARSEFRCI